MKNKNKTIKTRQTSIDHTVIVPFVYSAIGASNLSCLQAIYGLKGEHRHLDLRPETELIAYEAF